MEKGVRKGERRTRKKERDMDTETMRKNGSRERGEVETKEEQGDESWGKGGETKERGRDIQIVIEGKREKGEKRKKERQSGNWRRRKEMKEEEKRERGERKDEQK